MLQDKVALVTGSSRGIGRAIALRFGDGGARVVVNYRTDECAASAVVAEVEQRGGKAVAIRADVSDPAGVRTLFDAAERHFGCPDIVVSNVGAAQFGPIAQASDEDFDAMFQSNTRAGFVALRAAANRVRDGGRIVLISSGVTLANDVGTGLYAASKAAVEQLARVLARELGPRRVTVNSVLPGATRTEALLSGAPAGVLERTVANTPLGRIAEPDDIADVVAFLASDQSRWVTGHAIPAAGGAL